VIVHTPEELLVGGSIANAQHGVDAAAGAERSAAADNPLGNLVDGEFLKAIKTHAFPGLQKDLPVIRTPFVGGQEIVIHAAPHARFPAKAGTHFSTARTADT
jgi:hypothetical protein